jgi:hypothetical protein
MHHQPGGHPGRSGHLPHAHPIRTGFGEQTQRLITDHGLGREIRPVTNGN